MAFVGITKQLKRDVEHAVRRMSAAEGGTMKAPEQTVTPCAHHEWLRKALWGPLFGTPFEGHEDLTFNHLVRFAINGFQPEDRLRRYEKYDVTWTVLGVPRHAVIDDEGMHRTPVVVVERETHPDFEAHVQHAEATKEHLARWTAILNQVLEFLDTCKSLNEGLKVWPDLARYVPEKYIERVAEKVEKIKSDPNAAVNKLKEMDLDTITASTVLARMVSAGSGSAGAQT